MKAKPSSYWQGQTDATLGALASAINEIKLTLVRLEEKVDSRLSVLEEKIDSVRLWRAKVVGIAVAVSAVVTIGVRLLWGH